MFQDLKNFLDRKKTYLVAVAALSTATVAWATGEIASDAYVTAIFAAIATITMRAGITKSTG